MTVSRQRIGLVLGGGGAVGLAYHAGVLAALEHELEWDPRSADVIVDTSAVAMVATLLRRGVSAGDLAAVAVDGSPLALPPALEQRLKQRPAFDAVGAHRWLLRRPRLPRVSVLRRVAMKPWTFDFAHALASVVPDGVIDIADGGTDLEALFGVTWPPAGLRLCVVRQRDLRRVVLGRDTHPAVWRAVAASCAIPGYFQPVSIDGTAYLDGGVRSPTNADVLTRERVDLAIVVSPMSSRDLPPFGYLRVLRSHAKARLDRELDVLRARGTPAAVIEPGRAVTSLAGFNFMSDERVREIVSASYFDTADVLGEPPLRDVLAALTPRASQRQP